MVTIQKPITLIAFPIKNTDLDRSFVEYDHPVYVSPPGDIWDIWQVIRSIPGRQRRCDSL